VIVQEERFAHLGDGEDEIGWSNVLVELAGQFVANNLWKQHGDGLSKHDSLRFDT